MPFIDVQPKSSHGYYEKRCGGNFPRRGRCERPGSFTSKDLGFLPQKTRVFLSVSTEVFKLITMISLDIAEKEVYRQGEKLLMYYLTLARRQRLDFEKMCELISERTTLNTYEVEFVLSVLQEVAIENLELGRGIELGRLGCIEPSLNAKAVDCIDDVNLNTIKKTRLIYKPSKSIKAALKNMKYSIDARSRKRE